MILVCVHMLSPFSYVRLCATPWTVARQAPLCMGFSRQEYWSGVTCPPPRNLLDPGIEPTSFTSPALQAYSLLLSYGGSPHPQGPNLECERCGYLTYPTYFLPDYGLFLN